MVFMASNKNKNTELKPYQPNMIETVFILAFFFLAIALVKIIIPQAGIIEIIIAGAIGGGIGEAVFMIVEKIFAKIKRR